MCKVWAAQEYIYQSETYIKTKAIFLTCYTVPSGAIPIPWVLWNCFFYSQHSSPLTLLKSMSWILLQSPKSHLTPFIYEQCQLSSLTEVLGVSVYGLSFIPILFLKALKGTPQNTVGEENCLFMCQDRKEDLVITAPKDGLMLGCHTAQQQQYKWTGLVSEGVQKQSHGGQHLRIERHTDKAI